MLESNYTFIGYLDICLFCGRGSKIIIVADALTVWLLDLTSCRSLHWNKTSLKWIQRPRRCWSTWWVNLTVSIFFSFPGTAQTKKLSFCFSCSCGLVVMNRHCILVLATVMLLLSTTKGILSLQNCFCRLVNCEGWSYKYSYHEWLIRCAFTGNLIL